MEPIAVWGVAALHAAQQELLLVAAVGILLLGIEDKLFDGLWLVRSRPCSSVEGTTPLGP